MARGRENERSMRLFSNGEPWGWEQQGDKCRRDLESKVVYLLLSRGGDTELMEDG